MDGCWKTAELSGAVLLGACLLRASGMTPTQAAAEAIGLALLLKNDGWMVSQEDGHAAF